MQLATFPVRGERLSTTKFTSTMFEYSTRYSSKSMAVSCKLVRVIINKGKIEKNQVKFNWKHINNVLLLFLKREAFLVFTEIMNEHVQKQMLQQLCHKELAVQFAAWPVKYEIAFGEISAALLVDYGEIYEAVHVTRRKNTKYHLNKREIIMGNVKLIRFLELFYTVFWNECLLKNIYKIRTI